MPNDPSPVSRSPLSPTALPSGLANTTRRSGKPCPLRVYSLFPSAIGARYGYILSSLPRSVPATGIFSFCSRWSRVFQESTPFTAMAATMVLALCGLLLLLLPNATAVTTRARAAEGAGDAAPRDGGAQPAGPAGQAGQGGEA
eukprot:1191453-Prorocentrum_minimum.AAC.3